jgi:hypothetical protein
MPWLILRWCRLELRALKVEPLFVAKLIIAHDPAHRVLNHFPHTSAHNSVSGRNSKVVRSHPIRLGRFPCSTRFPGRFSCVCLSGTC